MMVVEVNVVNVLDNVDVVVSLIDIVVDDVVCDDQDAVVVAIAFVSELLISNDGVEDVDVDHLGDVVCWLLPVDNVDELLIVEVVVDDVRVVIFQVIDDDDCDAAAVDDVVDDTKWLVLQDVDKDNGDDDWCRNALIHAKEKVSKEDAKRRVRRVVVNKDWYEDVDVNELLKTMWSKMLKMSE